MISSMRGGQERARDKNKKEREERRE